MTMLEKLLVCEEYMNPLDFNRLISAMLPINPFAGVEFDIYKQTHDCCGSRAKDEQKETVNYAHKYWDAQRLIDKYANDYEKLENHFRKIKDSEMKHRELYRREVIENIKLRNKLAIERIKMKECKKYLAAYIELYIREVKR